MRRGFLSSEFFGTILGMAFSFYSGNPIYLTAFAGSYILSRCFFKKNRGGLLYSCFKTTEFYIYLISMAGLVYLYSPASAYCLVGLQALWNISRGYAKSLGGNRVQVF